MFLYIILEYLIPLFHTVFKYNEPHCDSLTLCIHLSILLHPPSALSQSAYLSRTLWFSLMGSPVTSFVLTGQWETPAWLKQNHTQHWSVRLSLFWIWSDSKQAVCILQSSSISVSDSENRQEECACNEMIICLCYALNVWCQWNNDWYCAIEKRESQNNYQLLKSMGWTAIQTTTERDNRR